MRLFHAFVSTLLACTVIAACTEPRSEVCTRVCKRTVECVEQSGAKMPVDEKECVAACASLEKDVADHGAKVNRVLECMNKQTSCAGVLECK